MTRIQKIRLTLMIGLLVFLLFGFFTQLYNRAALNDSLMEELLQSGVSVKGKVVRTYRTSVGPKSKITYVEVAFPVGGTQVSGAYPIGFLPDVLKSADENFPTGLEMDVIYLPAEPSTIVIPSLKPALGRRQEVMILLGLGFVPFAAICWLCVRSFRKR